MLEEKLRQASESSAKRSKRLLSLLVFGVFLCAVAVMVISSVGSNAPVITTSQPLSAPKSQDINQPELRGLFMERLQAYEEGLESALSETTLKQWNLEKDIELGSLKEHVISAFTKGDYSLAIKHLADLELMAKQTLTEWNTAFSSQIFMAREALDKDDYVAGKLHITKALLLKENDTEARRLEAKLELLPELLELLSRANVARIENNLEKEYAAIDKAFVIAPHRDGLKDRRKNLAEELRERQFSKLINSALFSVEKNDLKTARLNYNQAMLLYAKRSELRVLKDAIAKATVAQSLKQATGKAHRAIRQDNWREAKFIYVEASKRHPADKNIRDGLQLATKIVSLQAALRDYIERSYRLSDNNIAAAAEDLLIQARVFAPDSQSLSYQVVALKTLLEQVNVKVPVFVKSDNKTYILVRGVGKVGLTHGREIKLKPGEYTFEGSRSGYRSKLVQLRLPAGELHLKVEVVCDELI